MLRESLWHNHEFQTLLILSILLLAVFLLYPFRTLAIEPLPESGQLSPSELTKGIRVIIPERTSFSSLQIDSTLFGGSDILINIRLFFRAPEEYALYMLDGFDSTPIFVVTHGGSLLYNPRKDYVIYTRNTGVIFEVGIKKNQFVLKGAFRQLAAESEPSIKNTVAVDLPAILSQINNPKSEKIGQNEFLLHGYTKRQGYCEAYINPTAAIPLTKMMIYPKGQKTPFFAINKIETEVTIDDGIFRFQLKRLHDSGVPVKEIGMHEIKIADMSQVVNAVFFRSAMRHPEQRRQVAQRGQDVDWPSITRRDEKVSSILRKLFPIK